ncbi:MAG: acyl-coenzyme A thioesterase PaaI-like protein [Saprospiraceae bacterium]
MTKLEDIRSFLTESFPQNKCLVESIGELSAVVRHPIGIDELRPGGTVSGPIMMATADVGLYVAILGHIGIVPLTVTTSLNFNFMRKPAADSDLIAQCKLLKVGKTLVVGEVSLYSEGSEQIVAHAVGTYAIPPRS